MQPNCQPYLSFNECELWEVVYILVQVCGLHSFLKLLLKKKKKNNNMEFKPEALCGWKNE